MIFCHLPENLVTNTKKNWLTLQQNWNRCWKNASKTAVQKTAEATGDLIGNKIADIISSVGKSK